jgi:hypothetical protein
MASHQVKVGEYLPDTFRVELPLDIDHEGYFCITSQINEQYDNFIIDTKAYCLAKEDELIALNANYRGIFPLASTNAVGQKSKLPLYYFNSFNIGSLSFKEPFFEGIPPDNYIYDIMYKKILGVNVLNKLFWKFSIDDKQMVLFSKKDTGLLKQEVTGFYKIENGLRNHKIILSFLNDQLQDKFIFDLGFRGEIEINNKSFNRLSKQLPYRKFLITQTTTQNDTAYVFDGVDILWNGILISGCQVTHRKNVNRNLIGARLMHRFNFVLAYEEMTGLKPKEHLYIQPVKNFHQIKSRPYAPAFGFNAWEVRDDLIISHIETGGMAETAGLKLRDKILCIDNRRFDIKAEGYKEEDFLTYLADKSQIEIQIERNNEIMKFRLNLNQHETGED